MVQLLVTGMCGDLRHLRVCTFENGTLQVLPSDIGQRQPFYFFLQPSYWTQHQIGKSSQLEDDPESPLMTSSGDVFGFSALSVA